MNTNHDRCGPSTKRRFIVFILGFMGLAALHMSMRTIYPLSYHRSHHAEGSLSVLQGPNERHGKDVLAAWNVQEGRRLTVEVNAAASPVALNQQAGLTHSQWASEHASLDPPTNSSLHQLFTCSRQLLSIARTGHVDQVRIRRILHRQIEGAWSGMRAAAARAQPQDPTAARQSTAASTADSSLSAWAMPYRNNPNTTHPVILEIAGAAKCVARSLVTLGHHYACNHDIGLPPRLHQELKVLVAGALKNNQPLMPHYSLQLLRLVLPPQRPSQLPAVYVSLYESGSEDTTPVYLAVLDHLLSAAGVPASIVIKGDLVRTEGDYRITYLAKLRNTVLRPLWFPMHPAFPNGFPADRIVFLNDVFFCPQDIIRLLQYKTADFACGFDFQKYRRRANHRRRSLSSVDEDYVQEAMEGAAWSPDSKAQHMHQQGHQPGMFDTHDAPAQHISNSSAEPSGLDAAPHRRRLNFNFHFYDVWVGRDIKGHMISSHWPIIKHAPTRDLLFKGLPVPVHCCWNGMAVLNAAPFTKHGLRFRAGVEVEGDCKASECSLICDDYARLGYNKILVDPNVRMMYTVEKDSVYDPENFYAPLLSWKATRDALAGEGFSTSDDPAGLLWDPEVLKRHEVIPSSTVDCCNTDDKGKLDTTKWSSCHPVDVRGGRNFTGEFLNFLSEQWKSDHGMQEWIGPSKS